MVFSDLYGTELTTELGSADTSQRFTTVLRKRYVNEGQRVFAEQTGCYVKRGTLPLVSGTQEYDLETAFTDYLRPSQTSASLQRVGASTTSYTEGPDLPYVAEETLNQTRPNWRAESAGVPDCWTVRADGGSTYLVLVPAPSVPVAETWSVLVPYVAQPPDMTDDSHEPFGNATPRTVLRPYHRACVHYAAAMLEKLRKNDQGRELQLKMFAAIVTKYQADQAPRNGGRVRLAVDYRRALRRPRTGDPWRW